MEPEKTPTLWDPLGAWPRATTWLWGGLAIIVSVSFIPFYLGELSGRSNSMTDFFQDWASARNFLEGLPVYSNHRVTIPRYLGKKDLNESDLFVEINAHPPTSILLLIPFGALPYREALFRWNLLSLGMFAVSLALVWRGLRIPRSVRSVFPATTLSLLCFPLLVHIHFGQITLLILLLLTGVWTADRADRRILAGVLLGTAVTIKLFPAVLFLYFIVRKRWRTVASGLVSIALITMLTASILGIHAYRAYVNDVLPNVAKYRGLWFNLSLPGYWTKLFDPPREFSFIQPITRSPVLASISIYSTCVLILGTLAWFIVRARTRTELDLSFGLTMTAMLLVSPITWDHYLLLLLVPLAMAWTQLPESQGFRLLFVGIVVACWTWPYVVFDNTIPRGLVLGTAHPLHTVTIGSYQCYALIALFLLQIIELRRSTNHQLDPTPGSKGH
jgi:Glycosyltransferase family 87